MCPVDDFPLSETSIFPDNFCKRKLMELECYCSGKSGGCQWKGPLKNLKVGGMLCFVFKILGKVTHVLQLIFLSLNQIAAWQRRLQISARWWVLQLFEIDKKTSQRFNLRTFVRRVSVTILTLLTKALSTKHRGVLLSISGS